VVPNTDSHSNEVVDKLTLTEIVNQSHKITEIYEVARGFPIERHYSVCHISQAGQSPLSGCSGLNIQFYSIISELSCFLS
jgi:hypothetical protein